MEKLQSKNSNAIDLEFGGSKENRIEDQGSSIRNSAQKSSKLLVGGMLNRNGMFGGMARLNSTKNNSMIYFGVDVDIVVSGTKEMVSNTAEKKSVKKGKKETASKKHPKPPRPPRRPSLDEADMKLIREISELARLKSARNRRMKALKNLRTDKPSASLSNLFAMMVTILFLFVIIFQGLLGSRV